VKVTVITVSDRASRGEYEDLSGPEIVRILMEAYPDCRVRRDIVPDEKADLLQAFARAAEEDFILTTGGTGLSPRDITADETREFCDRELPGISERLRIESFKETPQAMISRGYSGMKGPTIIVNFPGSLKAVRLCTKVLIPVMEHSLKMLKGEGH
jgi:molybdenum cofactor synthesis domain-containing protein